MPSALGRGLSSLIPNADRTQRGANGSMQDVPPAAIAANPYQPRTQIDVRALDELTQSIREHGILQPLVVSPGKEPGRYELIAGERRLTAAKALRLPTVPVVIRDANAQHKLELALIENIQRTDLNPVERSMAYQRLIDEFSLTQAEVAQRVGMSREAVANTLRLLHLPQEMRDALGSGRITEGHAKVLLSMRDRSQQEKLFQAMLKGMTVAAGTREARKSASARTRKRQKSSATLDEYADRLREALGTKVLIEGTEHSGTIRIEYFAEEELRNLIKEITSS